MQHLQHLISSSRYSLVISLLLLMSCSSARKDVYYFQNSVYVEKADTTSQGMICFNFGDSTYSNDIRGVFDGHGKWKLSVDKKKIELTGVVKLKQTNSDNYRQVSYEFEVRKRGRVLVNNQFYLERKAK